MLLVVLPSATRSLLPGRAGVHFHCSLPDGGRAAGVMCGLGFVGGSSGHGRHVRRSASGSYSVALGPPDWLCCSPSDFQFFVSRLLSRREDSKGSGLSLPDHYQALPVPKKGGSLHLFGPLPSQRVPCCSSFQNGVGFGYCWRCGSLGPHPGSGGCLSQCARGAVFLRCLAFFVNGVVSVILLLPLVFLWLFGRSLA